LYVIGVFTAFTLSQAGMVRYWRRRADPGWRRRVAINGVGAAATGIVALLVVETKFLAGAWMVTVAVPVLIGFFFLVNRHYRTVPGIRPRFRELTGHRTDLEIVEAEGSRVEAVIDYLWALPRGESTFVTAIVPEQFKRPSLAAALARRTELQLKLRLLTEPGV